MMLLVTPVGFALHKRLLKDGLKRASSQSSIANQRQERVHPSAIGISITVGLSLSIADLSAAFNW